MQDDQQPQSQTQSSTPARPSSRPARGGGSNLGIPIAIVIAAALISAAIYFGGGGSLSKLAGNNATSTVTTNTQVTPEKKVEPVTTADHIRGNPNAPIMIVEYSDYDCPFCRLFHDTMTQVMDKYGADGKVAWVYRQFPLQTLHPNAPKIAEASECVADLGGNDAFWKFTDALNNSRKISYGPDGNVTGIEPTDMTRLPEFAAAGGVDKAAFQKCLDSGKYTAQIQDDFKKAVAAGGQGTPYSIVMVGGQQGVINGAQPFSVVDQIIGNLVSQMDVGELKASSTSGSGNG